MTKGRGWTGGMLLTVVMLLALCVGIAPAVEASVVLSEAAADVSALIEHFTLPPSAPGGGDVSALIEHFTTPPSTPSGGDVSALIEHLTTPGSAPLVTDGSDWCFPNTFCLAPAPPPPALDGGSDGSALIEHLTVPPAARVPEPATMILLGIGILALMLIGWRRADSLSRSR